MEPVQHVPFYQKNIDLINYHEEAPEVERNVGEVLKEYVGEVLKETVKLVAATCFLDILSASLAKGTSQQTTKLIYLAVVLAPITEESLFRGILLKTIHTIQNLYNHLILEREPTVKEMESQQKFRVHFSAFIFGAVHLLNPHKNIVTAITQFAEAYLTGVSFAYMSEKYHTLSITILTHGIHNALCIPMQSLTSFEYYLNAKTAFFMTTLVIYEIGVYLFATTNIDAHLGEFTRKAAKFCAALPRNVMNLYLPHPTPQEELVGV